MIFHRHQSHSNENLLTMIQHHANVDMNKSSSNFLFSQASDNQAFSFDPHHIHLYSNGIIECRKSFCMFCWYDRFSFAFNKDFHLFFVSLMFRSIDWVIEFIREGFFTGWLIWNMEFVYHERRIISESCARWERERRNVFYLDIHHVLSSYFQYNDEFEWIFWESSTEETFQSTNNKYFHTDEYNQSCSCFLWSRNENLPWFTTGMGRSSEEFICVRNAISFLIIPISRSI